LGPETHQSRPVTPEKTAQERERLILEHLPQVRLIARRIHERLPDTVSLDDIVSMGVIGLIAAVDHFEASHNVKLKTYAEYKIRGAILDSLRNLDWAPRQKRKMAKQIQAAIAAAGQRLQREPREDEIAEQLQLSLPGYHRWLTEVQGLGLGHLEYAAHQEGRDVLDYLSDSEDHLPSRLLERSELEKLLAEAIEQMPPMDRAVINLYYQDELTLRQIAQVVHLHQSRISQLKAQAISWLRAYVEQRWPNQRGG
jgi:RNA polymerase sigma factor for flagellar operon FliA